jgi:hypothetical protein
LLAASSARASSSLQMRPGRAAPPRRARSGSRSSASFALPKCLIRERNVRGPGIMAQTPQEK